MPDKDLPAPDYITLYVRPHLPVAWVNVDIIVTKGRTEPGATKEATDKMIDELED